MARVRTVDFLPEIFQTSTNREFLSATLDQLVQEPKFKTIQGFVGRRVGPGVNANDRYVAETDATRDDYQLEPGVIQVNPDDNTKIVDAITYPGINDALKLQGANTNKADRLYTSEFYSWDPFVDFDKFVNFSQYYWLPAGPDAVDVYAEPVPSTDNFVVTRENGVYTFSGVSGNDPTIPLVRGGTYTFQVAQNQKETVNFRVTNNATSAWVIDYQSNPTLTLVRGNTYVFTLVLSGNYPFYIKTQPGLGLNNQYNTGVTNNGAYQGNITFTVPQDAPDTLYYSSPTEFNMTGQINIIDATPGTGPGFWIQTDPGVSGKIPSTPNISSRDVLGVVNNGEDLGTITFNVPYADAQNFYYDLAWVGNQTTAYTVDLITTTLKFDEVNNQGVLNFIASTGGIDGITDLNNRTIVFANDIVDPVAGGWENESVFDPLASAGNVVSGAGSFDSIPFSYTTELDQDTRYSVWQIQYITSDDGYQYIKLASIKPINTLQKFAISAGAQWSSTQWYRNADGFIEQIPLLTAIKDVLYYQDGTDPEMYGRFRIIDSTSADVLDISEIIGKKNYISPNGVTFTNGLKVTFIGAVSPASYQNNSYYVEGVGSAIKLLPITNFITPETYTVSAGVPYASTPYDVGNYDASLNQPEITDYLTINRASLDLNPWTRSNRWFHVDVINASATYNNTIAVLNNEFRAKRPILEFRAGTKLFNFGTEGKQPVDIIDFSTTDALSQVNGTTGYGVDGYNFINGSRVIFAADLDPQVRNKIFVVEFITPDSVEPLIAEPVIHLVPATDSDVYYDQTVVCVSGATLQGKSFWFDGVDWITSQQKTSVNQPPLFDIYDSGDISLSNKVKYPSSDFTGTKLFSYAQGTGSNDSVLGFPLKYLSLTNVGDIVFNNNLYTDTFIYTKDSVSTTENISKGFARQYNTRLTYDTEIGWQTAITPSISRQQFKFSYDGNPLLLDVKVLENNVVPAIQIYVGTQYQEPGTYTFTTTNNTTTITLLNTFVAGEIVEVNVLSDQASSVAFYLVPENLSNNPLNVNSDQFTLGTIRTHYESVCENLLGIQGPINGANNSRDLGNLIPYGTNIVQQSSPLTLAGFFMRSAEYNVFKSIEYNSREYEKFKAQLLDTATRQDYTNYTIPEMLNAIITYLTAGKTQTNPFYWSDMIPTGSNYTSNSYTVTPISTNVFDLTTTYDFTSSNYKGLLIYVNDQLLTFGYDYEVATNGPRVTVTSTLSVGDVVTINEYTTTYGNFVPNTPTKMGLYPAFKPEIYYDTTYVNPTFVIQGHDGSKTVAFGDFRDDLLLEFETRIYNNLKVKSDIPLTAADVIPGQFRDTGYSLSEINTILSTDFLSWVGWNKLNYKSQDYIASNQFTWNYSSAGNKLTGTTTYDEQPLNIGAWRGIYRYFYDTEYPTTRPWEMLGFSEEPSWWQNQYGPAPYTSGNLVLWDDLAEGIVRDPAGSYVLPLYARPNLQQVIPANSEGDLLSPLSSVVGQYDSSQFQKSWTFGDGGPVEAAWEKSSSYPFAIMRLLALTRPAQFFSLFADRDLYKYSNTLGQYLYNERYRLDANGIEVYGLQSTGVGLSKASYINWIVDYNQQTGMSSTVNIETDTANLDVRLCYRMGTFTDKQYLKIYTEKSSPNSLNSSLLLPDESYNLLLYKNQPFEEVVYSSVIVQVVSGGYSVYGYSITNPYFEILASRAGGLTTTISAGGTTVTVPIEYTKDVVQVPYGYVFTNPAMVVDFLLSYGALLESQGLVFSDQENGKVLNWNQMSQEFLYWSNQGWETNSIINLNPTATSLTAVKAQAIVDNVMAQTQEQQILDQNRTTLPARNLVVDRFENTFVLKSLTEQTINYVDLKYTNFETMVVLDNISIFNDLIYNPATGARQSRINISAVVSAEWNGQLDAQGFILNNNNNVQKWQPNKKYTKGEIVIYKNNYWSAQTIVQPSADFDYGKWVKSDYTKIQGGLLPNLPNRSDQLANSYDVNQADLNFDQDLLSFGLIGFRPRTYMAALNLNDISQVNLYQEFIKDKGTIQSVRLLANANLGKEVAEYDIYENWAIQRGVYGASANRSFIELRLNEALLKSNPSTVQIAQPQQSTTADQPILLQDVWRESYKLTSPNVFPTTTITPTDVGLPTAGYVDLDDVDVTVFSLLGNLGFAPGVLDTIGIGTTIWAAKSNSWDWNIYRCSGIPGRVIEIDSNLNSTSTITFSKPHGLSANDVIIIRMFSSKFDGVYKVNSVSSPTQIVVDLSFSGTATGEGVAYFLQTMRVAQASDAYHLPYVNELVPGAKVWIDNNGSGLWEVIEKTSPFVSEDTLSPDTTTPNEKFGTSVAQGTNNIIAMVGAPGYGSQGSVFTYVKNDSNQYAQNSILELTSTDASGFGNTVTIGDQEWGAAGASTSYSNAGYATVIHRPAATNAFEITQLLVAPDEDFADGEFGYSVDVSDDERWMCVGAPGNNKVYVYGRVDTEVQRVKYITTATQTIYNYSDSIQIDNNSQLVVVLNNKILTIGTDYTNNGIDVVLSTAPVTGQTLIIQRRVGVQLDHEIYYNVEQDSATGSGSGAQFTVSRTRGDYEVTLTAAGTDYSVGDVLTVDAATIGGGTSPTNDLEITVTAEVGGEITEFTISGSGVDDTDQFVLNDYLYTARNIYSFSVIVDDVIQRPLLDYTFDDNTTTLTFVDNPSPGATILVNAGSYFEYVDTLTVDGLDSGARFGQSVSMTTDGAQIFVGCPFENNVAQADVGSTYVFNRSITRYIVTSPTTLVYTLPADTLNPVNVTLNGVFLTDTDQFYNGQYTVDLNDLTVTLNSNVTLAVGDVLEIENNIINQVQKITSTNPSASSQFGAVVDMCADNDELYIGAPYDSVVLLEAGSVDHWVDQARNYGTITSTVVDPTLTAGDTLSINSTPVAVPNSPNNTVEGFATAINNSGIPNVVATATDGLLTISVISYQNIEEGQILTVYPGITGTAYSDLGFEALVWAQTIVSPNPVVSAHFGSAVVMDSDYSSLIIGAPGGNNYEPVTFDGGKTYFDDHSTIFSTTIQQSGAVYTYDYLESVNDSVSNPGHFIFGQQIYDDSLKSLDQWGASVSYVTGKLLVGSPGSDLGDSTLSELNYGRVGVFENTVKGPSWVVRRQQTPVGDVALIDTAYMFDRLESAEAFYFDFINPLQGKILGAARRNIDFISPNDPAKYNVGPINNNGNYWATNQVGQIWWDITNTRFIDPSQGDLSYTSRRWGQLFPGSHVDIYQWVESSVPPAQYTGAGTPFDTTSYCVTTKLDNTGIFQTLYYFWVTGLTTINTGAGKTLSTDGITRYIESPSSSGIPYIAVIDASTIAIYNGAEYLSAFDTIIHIGYDQQATDENVHIEYELIAVDKPDSFISGNLYRKLQDSFCGVDTVGAKVPDVTLSPPERYGVEFRPRQSMFVDRYVALENYLGSANTIIKQYPIVESKDISLLYSREPEPTVSSGEWDKRLLTIEELSYQNLNSVALGYKYLIVSDSTQNGFWTIYEVIARGTGRTTQLVRVQNYDTSKYWYHIDWYDPTYNSSVVPVAQVANYAALATVSVPLGSSVKVLKNAQNKWEIYLNTDTGWIRVGLQDGTLQFDESLWNYQVGKFGFDVEVFDAQYFDQEPVIETRKIIQSINEQIFIGEQLIYRNQLLILMFNFIMSELKNPQWLMKTSLIDVQHRIRQLIPYQIYRQDNQEFVLDYLQEVKPYHVQVREFNLAYNGQDNYLGTLTDFDLPAYYNTSLELPQYVSPILLPYDHSTAVGTGTANTNSDTASDAEIWALQPYIEWFNNYTLSFDGVSIADNGSGYTEAPTLTVVGDCTVPAELTAIVNSAGRLVGVTIVNPGSGYITTPSITVTGVGTGAKLYAVMGNGLVRSFATTIKYDRYQYQSTIVDWEANVTYTNGTQVRYQAQVWAAIGTVNSEEFDPTQWTEVSASTLSGIDRTQGFYAPYVNEFGLSLPLLIDGLEYPGVQVMGPLFSQNTGYDIGNFDINPFDNISYGPEGRPTYDPAILDTIYESYYLDQYLGTRPTDINVDGGAYIDTYESHAPEELVPGAEFDTMDLRVYTRNITAYTGNGTTTVYAAPTGVSAVYVEVQGLVVDPADYTFAGGNVTFDTAPVFGTQIAIAQADGNNTSLEFRIFQDMRGVQATYRMLGITTTTLTQDLLEGDDIVYVADASALSEPGLAADFNINIAYPTGVTVMYNQNYYISLQDSFGILPTNTAYWQQISSTANTWGVLMVNGERIMYRYRDTVNNTVSGLLRGTAGTAVDVHYADALVYNMNRVNLLPDEYQNYVVNNTTLANGTETTFVATDLLSDDTPTDAVEVYVGGTRQYSGFTIISSTNIEVEFDTAPTAGVDVTILVRRGTWWYDVAIEDQTLYDCQTLAAKFFRGEI